ncbi:MAG: hypothetical protein ACLR0N_15220 [Bilophila wadsworthia]
MPGGASNKIGALGYVSCAEEVLRQLFDRGLAIDHMVVPSGSAGTHAGIIAGMVGNNAGIPVTGIGVNRKKPVQEAAVLNLANETLEYIGAEACVPAEKVSLDDYVAPATPAHRRHGRSRQNARPHGRHPARPRLLRQGHVRPYRSGPQGYFPKGSNVLFLTPAAPRRCMPRQPSAPNRLLLSPCSPAGASSHTSAERLRPSLVPRKRPSQCPAARAFSYGFRPSLFPQSAFPS